MESIIKQQSIIFIYKVLFNVLTQLGALQLFHIHICWKHLAGCGLVWKVHVNSLAPGRFQFNFR